MLAKEETIKVLESVGLENVESLLEKPPQSEFGDLAFPCFGMAKKEKKNPNQIAEEIAKKIKIPEGSLITKVEAKAGYVNFFFDWERISVTTLKEVLERKESFGKPGKIEKKKIMVEFSQPNPIHPMHIGHARGTFLGDSLAKILDFTGHDVVRANYMNNTGLQVAKLVTAYLLWAGNKKPEGKPDFWLWKYYVKFHEEVEKDPELEEKAREILRKREIERDEETTKTWDKLIEWCVQGFEGTYKKLGIGFDVYLYENTFRDSGKKIVENAIKKGIAFKAEEGQTVADLEKHGLPNCIILRSDGTGLYHTSDFGMTVHKFEKYKLDKLVWVVASAQNLYFKQLFKILELVGYDWTENCYHFAFNLVHLPEGRMASRKGRAVLLDEVVDKLIKLAYEEVNKRNPKLSEKEKQKIAEKIAIGALKYAMVKIEPNNSITFDFKKMLSFEGDTGPYLQYAHTRCCGILKKAGKWEPSFEVSKLKKQEKELVKLLARFPEVVGDAAKDMKPHYICSYVFDLATAFDRFYEFCPVLKAENEKLKNFRLTLVSATKNVLKNSLNLMGIEPLEKM